MFRRQAVAGIAALATGLVYPEKFEGKSPPLVAAGGNRPPFSGQGLPGKGMALDVISQVMARAGLDVETHLMPWARLLHSTAQGDVDLVGTVFRDASIDQIMHVSPSFHKTDILFVRQAGSTITVPGYAALAGRSIAVGDQFLYEDRFDADQSLNKTVVVTTQQGLQMVAHGRADLTLDSAEVLHHILTRELPELAAKVEILAPPLTTRTMHVGISKSHQSAENLVRLVSDTMDEMARDGSLDALIRRHLGS